MRTTADYFDGILWPAAAGNVAWATITVAMRESRPDDFAARLILLGLLASYLSFEWWRRPRTIHGTPATVFGALHLITMAILATVIAENRSAEMMACILTLALGVTSFGHALALWGSESRWWLCGVSVAGLVVLGIGWRVEPGLGESTIPVVVAAIVVLTLWVGVRGWGVAGSSAGGCHGTKCVDIQSTSVTESHKCSGCQRCCQ